MLGALILDLHPKGHRFLMDLSVQTHLILSYFLGMKKSSVSSLSSLEGDLWQLRSCDGVGVTLLQLGLLTVTIHPMLLPQKAFYFPTQ